MDMDVDQGKVWEIVVRDSGGRFMETFVLAGDVQEALTSAAVQGEAAMTTGAEPQMLREARLAGRSEQREQVYAYLMTNDARPGSRAAASARVMRGRCRCRCSVFPHTSGLRSGGDSHCASCGRQRCPRFRRAGRLHRAWWAVREEIAERRRYGWW